MSFWNTNDREESKPTWLTPAQKKECVRTVKGWELPVGAGVANVAGQFEGTKTLGTTGFIPQWELLVALPLDPSVTGVTSSSYANRDTPTFYGATASSDTTAYAPYFSFPFQGDSATAGGPDSTGLSWAAYSETQGITWGLNGYGASTLNWSKSGGLTGYIKVIANDVNQTNDLTITMTGPSGGIVNGWNFYTKDDVLDASKVPVAVYEAMFGPTASDNTSIGVIKLSNLLVARDYGLTATVVDAAAPGNLTGTSFFTITVVA
jgi:hypothetical protein